MKKTALVTGASRGIGREIARQMAKQGYNVIINYHHSESLAKSLEQELLNDGSHAVAIKADVSDLAQVKSMMDSVEQQFGGVDILINNAGIARQKLFTDTTEDEWDRIFDVNVKGVFHCCKQVLPYMIRRHQGKIINISSVWGMVGASCEVSYSSAKAAIIGMTKALAKEVGPSNIQVNCVAPGVIQTEMNQNLDAETIEELEQETPLGIIGQPIDVAKTGDL
ncbi:MAG: short-chain dehydrogenase/reductase [Oscillospiraceae bacterium]|nr:short-chain dehydrogenase/reductase [Oscillospiraceae bacterium]